MSLSLYATSIPPLKHGLKALSGVLDKAERHAAACKIEPEALLRDRLYPDMFPMIRQVQIACDMAKGGACRLAGREVPSHPDTETSFAELKARIAKGEVVNTDFASMKITLRESPNAWAAYEAALA